MVCLSADQLFPLTAGGLQISCFHSQQGVCRSAVSTHSRGVPTNMSTQAPTFLQPLQSVVALEGSAATFEAQISFSDGRAVLRIPAVTAAHSGRFSVRATNGAGQATSTAELLVTASRNILRHWRIDKHMKERVNEERVNEERVDEERVNEERVDEERVDEERVNEERVDEERVDEERVDEERVNEERVDEERVMRNGLMRNGLMRNG
ncbi:hypothetical protein F7725_002656 [Dissostichus mawsoni]|uniref:Immunoglobulin I-set domain-containing protein n=1 Tax=Dissostichus mawsoni TaxID=36200 RepID=A0A7J5Y578_DISMA|nr:hypothetical protein F7725_002656 [Dissostichus mawsoni]